MRGIAKQITLRMNERVHETLQEMVTKTPWIKFNVLVSGIIYQHCTFIGTNLSDDEFKALISGKHVVIRPPLAVKEPIGFLTGGKK
jgi:hypothetical protein